jgi:CrcB protein
MPAAWDGRRVAAIAVGGIGGAALRWAALATVTAGAFPWPVLAINVAGSFVLGLLLAEEYAHPTARLLVHDAGGIGFCGGLTTFSTFSVEVVNLVRDDHGTSAVLYVLASVIGTIVAVLAGAAVLRRVRAVSLPVEGQP